jgi:hypothetical protein
MNRPAIAEHNERALDLARLNSTVDSICERDGFDALCGCLNEAKARKLGELPDDAREGWIA